MEDMIFDDDEYKFKLENFEGPLALLLEIIRKNKLDIEEVRLADLTSQYLEYMDQLDTLDMEKASEFITIAATLIEIKSKSLLPRPEEEQLDEEDSEMLLLNRLKEYKLYFSFYEHFFVSGSFSCILLGKKRLNRTKWVILIVDKGV